MTNGILTTYVAMVFALAAPVFAQQRFDSADAAAQALIDGAEKHDGARLAAIFGPQGNAILTSGNPAQDRAEQSEFSQLASTKHQLIVDPRNSNRVILSIGDEDWPFPVPIVRSNGKWSFDASEARTEMEARRIGTHELDAIEICAGYVEAQQKYASEDHDKDGVFQYAVSHDGRRGRARRTRSAGAARSCGRDLGRAEKSLDAVSWVFFPHPRWARSPCARRSA